MRSEEEEDEEEDEEEEDWVGVWADEDDAKRAELADKAECGSSAARGSAGAVSKANRAEEDDASAAGSSTDLTATWSLLLAPPTIKLWSAE
jgi:hypothetical protein